MAFDRHTLLGGALVAIILAACIAGVVITGGPGEARKQKEDQARLQVVSTTALALACYYQARGEIPEDLSIVQEELSHPTSDARQQDYCSTAEYRKDPFTGEDFRLIREGSNVTHICADFATAALDDQASFLPFPVATNSVVPDIAAPRPTAGEHCFELNLAGKLGY
jgi:type II secretory pathway pseudopilin PulG